MQYAAERASVGFFLHTGVFESPGRTALYANRAEIGGSVYLSDGFRSEGRVRLNSTRIASDLSLMGGTFRNTTARLGEDAGHEQPHAEFALHIAEARIYGRIWLGPATTMDQQARIEGSVNFRAAHAGELVLDPLSLPSTRVRTSAPPGNDDRPGMSSEVDCIFVLDAFTYDHLDNRSKTDSPVTAAKKLLDLQPSFHRGRDFRPQPYEQLIKMFRAIGRDDEAKQIAKLKAKGKRRRDLQRLNQLLRSRLTTRPAGALRWLGPLAWIAWPLTATFAALKWTIRSLAIGAVWLIKDWFLGEGYRGANAGVAAVVLILVGTWLYSSAAEDGLFIPTDKMFVQNPEMRRDCAGSSQSTEPDAQIDWYRCRKPPDGFTHLHPLVYSLDLMIPFSPLGQRRDWRIDDSREMRLNFWGFSPIAVNGTFVYWFSIFQAYAAIGLYTLLIAFLTGAIKKE